MAYAYLYAYARRMRGKVQGARSRLFSIRENRWFAEDNKDSVVHRYMGVEPGGKGHRLDRIVPFHDLIVLKLYDSSLGQRQRAITYWEICVWCAVVHLLGCQPRGKGHRLDRIVPFLD